MDGKRFDALSKSVAGTATRRGALGGAFASGLMAAFGLKQTPVAAQQEEQEGQEAQQGTCVLDFSATVRQGASANQAVRGELSFGLSGKGDLQNASLKLADGTTVPVVGQATGRSLQMRMQSTSTTPQVLVAIGVGEEEISACKGAIDGLLSGPTAGDMGDWHATVLRSTGAVGGASGADKEQKKDKKAQEAGAGGAATAGAPSGGGGKESKKDKKAGGGGGGNAGGTQAPPTNTGGTQAPQTGGTTACATGLTQCGETCVDLTSDLNNCGACGSVCESGLVPVECRNGVCERANCAEGQEFCGAADGCRDLNTDPEHCGACGNSCGGGSCANGACQATPPATCDQGLTDCGGTCVNTATDPANCGACGAACPTGNECADGVCQAPVAPPADNCVPQGLTACAGFCVDTTSDPANCGACGAACAAGESCVDGVCQATAPAQAATCAAGETDCGGVCVNTQTDFGNCGGCGAACPAGNECVGGVCQAPPAAATCPAGQIECTPGVCTDPMTDLANCGACGNVCQNQCTAGVCA